MLQNEGASYITIEIVVHHYRPSTTLTRVRQLRDYQSHLDSQTQKREANKNKSKEEKNFDLI